MKLRLYHIMLINFIPFVLFAQQVFPDPVMPGEPFTSIKKSKVMILGTFHFRNGGKDDYKPKYSVNIKSKQRQNEIMELLQVLKNFHPTKIAIESKPERQAFHDSLFHEFVASRYQPEDNEVFQVCYRLAKMMGHHKVYTVDAPGRSYSPEIDLDSMIKELHQERYRDSTYSKKYFELYAMDDSLISVWPILKSLRYLNSEERLTKGLGHYLIGDFKVGIPGNYAGPDAATSWWNRNLRIFANILQLAAASKEERVFVLIGAGHLQILRLLALACPEIEFVDAFEFLK